MEPTAGRNYRSLRERFLFPSLRYVLKTPAARRQPRYSVSHLLNSPFGEPRDDLRTYIFGFSAVESKAPTLDRSIKEFVRERRCARTGRLTFEFASFGGRSATWSWPLYRFLISSSCAMAVMEESMLANGRQQPFSFHKVLVRIR